MQLKKVKNEKNIIFENRRSIRKYKKDFEISKEELSNIINDALTAPSSLNLQPWRFFIIHSKKAREEVGEFMMYNKLQHETCSAIIAVYAEISHISRAEELLGGEVKLGLRDEKNKNDMVEFIKKSLSTRSEEHIIRSHFLDCGFVTMQLMLSAVNYGYSTNPIGAYDRVGLSKYLNIDTSKYVPVILLTIGKADESGKTTSRFETNEVSTWL